MHRMTQKEFILNNGSYCPFCESKETANVNGSDLTYYLQEHRNCINCNKEWIEKHKLAGYKLIKD